MCHQSLHFDFSVIANDESMQTIKDKRKYKSQQLLKMLALIVLTRDLSRFLYWCGPWSVGSQPQTVTTHGFSSGRVLASCTHAATWCCCCHGNCAVSTQPISSFSNSVNRQLSADAFFEEIIHSGPILMKLYQPVLGVRFFLKHSVVYVHLTSFTSYLSILVRLSLWTRMLLLNSLILREPLTVDCKIWPQEN